MSELVDTELNPDWPQFSDKSDVVTEAIPPLTPGSGPYLSYGIQWILSGALVSLAVMWFIRAEIVEYKCDYAEQEEMERNFRDIGAMESIDDADGTEDTASESSNAAIPTLPQAKPEEGCATELHRQRMAQRYGNTGHRAMGYCDNRYDE